jgi:hypothetical protein
MTIVIGETIGACHNQWTNDLIYLPRLGGRDTKRLNLLAVITWRLFLIIMCTSPASHLLRHILRTSGVEKELMLEFL